VKNISLFGLVAFSSILAFEGATEDKVSLELISATAERIGPMSIQQGAEYVVTNAVTINCKVVIDNQTGAPLTVMSSFYSAFDGLWILASDPSSKEIVRQPSTAIQSPFTFIDKRPFPLPNGRTTNESLGSAIFGIPATNTSVRVRLEGTLPQSAFTGSLTSSVVEVAIMETYPPSAVRSLTWQTVKEGTICPSNSVLRNLSSEVCYLDSTVGKISVPLMPGQTLFTGTEFRLRNAPEKVEMTTVPVSAGK